MKTTTAPPAVPPISDTRFSSANSAFSPLSASSSLPSSSSSNKDAIFFPCFSGAGVFSSAASLYALQSGEDEKTTRCCQEASFEKNGNSEQQEFAPQSALASSTQHQYQQPAWQGDDYWHLLRTLRQSNCLTEKEWEASIAKIQDMQCSIKGSDLNSAMAMAAKILITISKSSADNHIQDDAAENEECVQPTMSSPQVQHKHPNRLAVPEDRVHLTAYHCYARANLLEIFEKDGRVGIRCAYCSSGHRGHFPKGLDKIYKTFCTSFLSKGKHLHTCKKIPAKVKNQYAKFKGPKVRGNTKHWVKSAKELGMVEIKKNGEKYLQFKSCASVAKTQTHG